MKSILITLFVLPFGLSAQIGMGGNNPYALVDEIAGTAVTVSNVDYSLWYDAVSYFGANVQNMPFETGVLMTTGSKYCAMGPNHNSGHGVDNLEPGFGFLNTIVDGQTKNAAVLVFDFVPLGDTLYLPYIFGSDEYPEYVSTTFKDVFVVIINGPGYDSVNIARAPDNSIISINTVNNGTANFGPCMNCSVYQYNGDGSTSPYSSSDMYLQYDGLTKPLVAKAAVVPGQTYHLTLAIADVGDGILDSGVFLKSRGMTADVPSYILESSVDVYPNPVTDQFTISLKEGSLLESYELVDVSGKCLDKGELGSFTQVDFSEMASGMYHLHLIAKTGSITKKVVKY
ncbi:MAG: choice-of-anchor L domain-containing protein [Fluviicola sp.]|nr:choice-of-anchor L domain-containing protein [Fluviicola sp.]